MSTQSTERELPFSHDFAERVLAQADGIRRRRRWHVGVAAAALTATAVTAGVLLVLPTGETTPASAISVAAISKERLDPSDNAQIDPLQFLFPDAPALARFADTYSEMTYDPGRKPTQMLFADDGDTTNDLWSLERERLP